MKYKLFVAFLALDKSRPARGAWVEILPVIEAPWDAAVAPRKGRVG